MIKVTGVEEFIHGLETWVAGTERLAQGAFRGLVAQAFKFCVYGTPEWSGNLVYNWRLSVGSVSHGYDKFVDYDNLAMGQDAPEPFSRLRPNYEVISHVFAREALDIPKITLGSKVYISNATPYAAEVEQGIGPNGRDIRSANKHPEIEMVLAAERKFSKLAELSTFKALEMAKSANLQAGVS